MNNSMQLQDKVFKCRDCGEDFVFTVGEQRFFATKGFADPRRCAPCLAQRKAEGIDAIPPPRPMKEKLKA